MGILDFLRPNPAKTAEKQAKKMDESVNRVITQIAQESLILKDIKEEIQLIKNHISDAKKSSDVKKALKKLKQDQRYSSRTMRRTYNQEKIIQKALKIEEQARSKNTTEENTSKIQERISTEVKSLLKDMDTYTTEIGLLIYQFDHLEKLDEGALEALLIELEKTVNDAEKWIAALSVDTNKAKEINTKFIKQSHATNEQQANELVTEKKYYEAIEIYNHIKKYDKVIETIKKKLNTKKLDQFRWNKYEHQHEMQVLEDAYKNKGDYEEGLCILFQRTISPPYSASQSTLEQWCTSQEEIATHYLPSKWDEEKRVNLTIYCLNAVPLEINQTKLNALIGMIYLNHSYGNKGNYDKAFIHFMQAKLFAHALNIRRFTSQFNEPLPPELRQDGATLNAIEKKTLSENGFWIRGG